jgi:hypothetical protein
MGLDKDIDMVALKETINEMVWIYCDPKVSEKQQANLSRDIMTLCRQVLLGTFDRKEKNVRE